MTGPTPKTSVALVPDARTVHRRREQVHTDQRQIALRLQRLLLQTDELARAVELGDTELPRVCHRGQHGMGKPGLDARNSSTSAVMPPTMKLSPRYITKSSSPRNSLLTRTACASLSGADCRMLGHLQPERLARVDRGTDCWLGVADHDPHLGNSRAADRL
jgi:hypothetical protein